MSENLPPLYYLSDNDPKLLPEWAYFFMRLGQQLATMPSVDHRLVVGLAIPTRIFACSLIATGVVIERAGIKNLADDMQQQYILNLEPGTSVHIRRDNNRKLRGIVETFEEYNGKPYIFIRTTKSERRGFPLDDYASRITVSDRDVHLPENQQIGRVIETPSKFLLGCLGEALAQKYILDSSFEVLIIGKKPVIQHEVCEIPFIYKDSAKLGSVTGYLQEIMRVRQFSGSNKSYRVQFVSASSAKLEKEFHGRRGPASVVFDGAVAYIKHGHKWSNVHHIILLDRTERQFSDAVELLNQNYAYRLSGGFKFPIKIPDGIEMMIYRGSVQ